MNGRCGTVRTAVNSTASVQYSSVQLSLGDVNGLMAQDDILVIRIRCAMKVMPLQKISSCLANIAH